MPDGAACEAIARALHEAWLRHRLAAGELPASRPSLVPWDELPEEFRRSSHETARHLGKLVEGEGYEIARATGTGDVLTAEEVERLAERVHERWFEERSRRGRARPHPDLVPWKELSEESREIDRHLLREFPRALAAAGLAIRRR